MISGENSKHWSPTTALLWLLQSMERKNYGSSTMISMVPGTTKTLSRLTSTDALIGTLWDSREVYEMWDPMRFAKNFSTPEFVIHNELDYRLPVSEGIAMFNALQEQGVPSRFLSFPDEGHWVLDQENSLFWHQVSSMQETVR